MKDLGELGKGSDVILQVMGSKWGIFIVEHIYTCSSIVASGLQLSLVFCSVTLQSFACHSCGFHRRLHNPGTPS